MTCTILRPNPQELFDQLRNMFATTVLGGGVVIPESNEWWVVTNDYAMAEQYYAIADQLWRESNPETACCDNLYKMAAQHGVFPLPAVHAQGYAKLTGVPGTSVPPSLEISTSIGLFNSVGTIPLTVPTSGELVIRIRAVVPGAEMNSNGQVTEGTLTTVAPGIDAEVSICGGQFCGGGPVEDCESFRKRYIDRLAYHPRATMEWIKQKIMEFPCVTRVCVREGECCRCEPNCQCVECRCKNCGNHMEFYAMFDTAFPGGIPPQNVVDDITIWLFGAHQGYGEGQVEIGVCGKIYAPIPLVVDVFIDIVGCPSIGQKQLIEDDVRALFGRICPSLPLRVKQIELIVASVLGADVNSAARFEIPEYEPISYGRQYPKVFVTQCGDLEPACDVVPVLGTITFTPPDRAATTC